MWIGRSSLIAFSIAAIACAERPPRVVGEGCELSTECAAPLACRLGACREECRDARDCRAGLLCIRDENRLGVCQVPDERECSLTSDCPEGLVCRFNTCTTQCRSDRDCINGLICDVVEGDERACRDPTEDECRLNSDCANPLHVCARDFRCRVECITSRDCRDGNECDVFAATPSCVPPSMLTDGGVDSGMDARMDAVVDARMDAVVDAAMDVPTDAVVDAGDAGLIAPPPAYVGGANNNGAYLAGGRLLVWGTSGDGQVGTISAAVFPPTEITVPGGAITAYGVGASHVCAATDRIYCWGRNDLGQLGRTAGAADPTPRAITAALSGTVGIALGHGFSCAWTDTRVHCWGDNTSGQLGAGPSGAGVFTEVPTTVDLGGRPARVFAGEQHTCAIRADGQLFCWGRNFFRELGDGTTIDRPTPVAVPVPPVIDVGVGRSHTCVVHADGSVRCWGENRFGMVGDGTTSPSRNPSLVTGLSSAASRVSAGRNHSCAVLVSGDIACWGSSLNGQLGVPVIFPFEEPTPVTSALRSSPSSINAGPDYTCAHYGGGVAECVGSNAMGQFGTTAPDTAEIPVMLTWL